MKSTEGTEYDVVVLGSGVAAESQARHLARTIPGARIALVDDGGEDAAAYDKFVEIASLFFTQDLGFAEGLVDGHMPSSGFHFHWPIPGRPARTLADYEHVWANRELPVQMWLIDRERLTQSLATANRLAGIPRLRGRITGLDLAPGAAWKTLDWVAEDGSETVLKARFVIVASGSGGSSALVAAGLGAPTAMSHPRAGRATIRIGDADPSSLLAGAPEGVSTVSRFHALHYFFGEGHWTSVTPTQPSGREFVVSVLHHHGYVGADEVSTPGALLRFLDRHHAPVGKLASGGTMLGFEYVDQLARSSDRFLSRDGWARVGESAFDTDLIYASGGTTLAFTVTSATEAARALLAGEQGAGDLCEALDEFLAAYRDSGIGIAEMQERHLHHAGAMSHRVYFEWMWWFGIHIPLFLGKWHLRPEFARAYAGAIRTHVQGILPAVYAALTLAVERGRPIGVLDPYRADQFIGGYGTPRAHDLYLENARLGRWECNVFRGLRRTLVLIALWYLRLLWRVSGPKGLLSAEAARIVGSVLAPAARAWLDDRAFRKKRRRGRAAEYRKSNTLACRMAAEIR